jgi:hypothetical protein
MPVTIWTVNRFPPDLSRANDYLPVLMTFLRFRHFISGSLVFVSIGTYLTKSSFAFSVTLTTMVFVHSNLRWFGASTCIAAPRGPPSSTVKHGAQTAMQSFAFVAHNHRHISDRRFFYKKNPLGQSLTWKHVCCEVL